MSPFGLLDADGNAFEMTAPLTPEGPSMVRGGAYFFAAIQARTSARFDIPTNLREESIGLRVCATWPPSADKK